MKCTICGKEINKKEGKLVEKRSLILCNDCFENYVFKCDCCNEYELISNLSVKHDENFGILLFCEECMKKTCLINSENFNHFQIPKFELKKEELK